MLRAKRRRTRTHDINGNPIFNTMNSTPLQSAYVNVNNNQKQLQDCKCTSCGNPNSGCICLYSSIKQNSFKIKNFPLPEFDGVYKVSEPIFNGIPFPTGYVGYPIKAYKSDNNYFLQIHSIPAAPSFAQVVWVGYSGSNNPSTPLIVSGPFISTSSPWKSLNTITQWALPPAGFSEYPNISATFNNKTVFFCNDKIIRNPIPGYRKQLLFTGKLSNGHKESFSPTINELCDHSKKLPAQKRALTKNTVYKDNYAKTCGAFRKDNVIGIDDQGNLIVNNSKSESKDANLCGYSQVKKTTQNRNGWVNDKYNYSSKQYLERRCRTFGNLGFNFLSNKSIKGSKNSEFLTGCSNARVYSNLPLKRGNKDCSGSKSQQIFVKFRFQPSLSTPTSQTSLYGYGNEINFPDNARLNPDNLKGNVIAILNLTQIVLPAEDKYGFEIMLTKALEKQFNEDTLKNFKFILNFNDINIQIPYSDLVRTTPGTFFDYEVYYDETKPNYHLIKKMINNGNIVGKNINVMMGKIESPIENCDLSCNNILGLDCTVMNCSQQMDNFGNISCAKKGYTICEATNNNCKAVYKRSNPRFSTQGAVSGGSRINRLKYQTKIKAQSTRYQVNGNDSTNKTSAVNTNLGPQSFDDHINSVNGFGGASNGTYPVSLYRNTFPTYKANLSGTCVGKSLTFNGLPQRCKMPEEKPSCRALQTLPQKCNFRCNTKYNCKANK